MLSLIAGFINAIIMKYVANLNVFEFLMLMYVFSIFIEVYKISRNIRN